MRRWLSLLIPAAVGIGLLMRAMLRRVRGRVHRPLRADNTDAVIAALEQAQLRERFEELAPELRLTHAGHGRPRWTSDVELHALMSIGVVECVKEAHIAGMLDVYRLTDKGRDVQTRLRHQRASAR